jgi:hypothetical protein
VERRSKTTIAMSSLLYPMKQQSPSSTTTTTTTTAPLKYRRTAEVMTIPEEQIRADGSYHHYHSVVARPMSPTTYHHSPHPPPPVLYDTSVSSATLTNSAEDGRSTGSGGYHQYHHHHHPPPNNNSNHIPLHHQQQPQYYNYSSSPPQPRTKTAVVGSRQQHGLLVQNYEAAVQASHHPHPTKMSSSLGVPHSYSTDNNHNNHHHHPHTSRSSDRHHPPPPVSTEPYVTQSEPGGVPSEHDRFAAYVNRFAELDPRMDHRYGTSNNNNNNNVPDSSKYHHHHHHLSNNSNRDEKKFDEGTAASRSEHPEPVLSLSSSTKDRFRSHANRRAQKSLPPNNLTSSSKGSSNSTTIATSRSQDDPLSRRRGGIRMRETSTAGVVMNSPRHGEASSDIVVSTPSGRTRDLARRFEQRMAEKQLLQQQQQQQRQSTVGEDVAVATSSRATNTLKSSDQELSHQPLEETSSKPTPQPHHYYPQYSLGATYIPIPKPLQQSYHVEKIPSDERGDVALKLDDTGPTTLRRGRTEDSDEKWIQPSRSSQQSPNDNESQYHHRSPQSNDTPHHSNISRVSSNTGFHDRSAMEERNSPHPRSERTPNHFGGHNGLQQLSRQHEQHVKSARLEDKEIRSVVPLAETSRRDARTTKLASEPPQPSSSRHSEIERQPRERSKSLGPPVRRRNRPLHAPAPMMPVDSSPYHAAPPVSLQQQQQEHHRGDHHNNTTEPMREPVIRRLGQRAEIETPSPARVQELRRKLWTEDELLQVKVRSSYHDTEGTNYPRQSHYNGPEMAGSAGQRNARSLSPKTQRTRNAQNEMQHPSGASKETNGMLFKSRYYEAALRGEMGGAPPIPGLVSSKDVGRPDPVLQVKRSFESGSSQRKTNSSTGYPSGSNDDVETAEAIQTTISDRTPIQSMDKTRSARLDHMAKLQNTDASMQDQLAFSLLKKITQVNRDNPQAALAEIDALLKQQQRADETGLPGDPKETIPQADMNSATHDSMTVPGVEQARPMVVADESSAESDDGTSVSSMTNPTYQELNGKDTLMNASSNGRPRASVLEGFQNSPGPHIPVSSNRRQMSETNQRNSTVYEPIKKEGMAPLQMDTSRSKHQTMSAGNVDTNFHGQAIDEAAMIRETQLNVIAPTAKNKSTPSLFAQLETLVSPRRKDDPMSHSDEIEKKIKMWDDVSTGVIPVVSESQKTNRAGAHTEEVLSTGTTIELGSIVTDTERRDLSPGSALRRAHPWDAAIPVRMGQISVKDTSMDCGDGVEAQYTPKYAEAKLSPDRSGISPVRRLRKDRMSREKSSTAEAINATKVTHDMLVQKRLHVCEEKKEELLCDPRQQQQAKDLSDDFDSAWVSLPSSSYFGSRSPRSSTPKSQRPDEMLPATSETLPARERTDYRPDGEVEVQYVDNNNRPRPRTDLQVFAPEEGDSLPANLPHAALGSTRGLYPRHRKSATFDDGRPANSALPGAVTASGSFETAPVESQDTSQKPRGRGLRGFLKRKQAEKAQLGYNIDRDAATSVSMASTRRSNYTTVTTTTKPLGDAVDVEESPPTNYPESSNRYYRRSAKSRSPSRGRARSLDERRTRNSSLGRKFNRLLRVHDNDTNIPAV